MNSNAPSRSSSNATSAGAPTFSVPRSWNASKTRAALLVTHAITCSSDMPSSRNFDMTLQVDNAAGAALRRPVGGNRVGEKALLDRALRLLPADMTDGSVADV